MLGQGRGFELIVAVLNLRALGVPFEQTGVADRLEIERALVTGGVRVTA